MADRVAEGFLNDAANRSADEPAETLASRRDGELITDLGLPPSPERDHVLDRLGEQKWAHLVVEGPGEFAAFLLLQGQQELVQAPIVRIGGGQPSCHPIEAGTQARQFGRQPAADPRLVTAVADLLQRFSQSLEWVERPANEEIDQ
jgi:hypothetical protein